MPHNALNYTKCAVIVHGKSEFVLVKYIYTNLHLPVKIIAKDKGRGSIQINGLSENFKLFIIMDTDDCDENTKSKYISGELFEGHPLKEYIVPVYNVSNLEDVMIKAGIMVKRISDAQKGSYYTKIFPINTGPLSVDTVNQVRTFAKKIEGITETNMLTFVEYCFQQMPGEKLWEERGEK